MDLADHLTDEARTTMARVAFELLQAGDYMGAGTIFTGLMALDETDATPVGGLAAVKESQGDIRAAVELYEQALRLNPGNAWARKRRERIKKTEV